MKRCEVTVRKNCTKTDQRSIRPNIQAQWPKADAQGIEGRKKKKKGEQIAMLPQNIL